jgi:peptidoglycan/xylan/chitin deacetylase (PgdA/CDA1 family)
VLRPLDRRTSIRTVPEGSSVVLGYHGVSKADFDPWDLFLPPELFAEHLEALTKHFRPVSLEDLVEAAVQGEPIHRGVALTFDDGYRSLLAEAKPALERYGVPGTVFIASGYVGSGVDFWWDVLEPIAFSPRRPSIGSEQLDDVHVDWSLGPEALYFSLYEQLSPYPHARRSALLEELAPLAEPDSPSPQTMTPEELLELAGSDLVEIGSHTVWHPRLPELEPVQQLEEMRRSRTDLEEMLGRPVTSFAFPHGEFTADSIACAREAGFTRVCTSKYAALRQGADRFAIPRCFIYGNVHGDELAWKLSLAYRLPAPADPQ